MLKRLRQQLDELDLSTFPDDVRQLFRLFVDSLERSEAERGQLTTALRSALKAVDEGQLALWTDAIERRKAEHERDAFFRMSKDLMAIIDADGRVVQFNPTWKKVLGYSDEELRDVSILSLIHPDDRAKSAETGGKLLHASGELISFENRYRAKSGEYRWLSWNATFDADANLVFAVGRDFTDKRKAELELAQGQKLEAVGQLASGVAHEINTPVQFIGDNIQFLKDAFGDLLKTLQPVASGDGDLETLRRDFGRIDIDYLLVEIPRSLDAAKDGVGRVAELVRALKDFAHPDPLEMGFSDLNKALKQTLIVARNEVKYVAQVETELGEVPAVLCHIGALNQVFLNLLVNAAHAIDDARKVNGEGWKGVIRVKTWVERGQVVVAISDTGCGIPPEIQPKIFDSFFTTKEVGRGTGQGLAIARNIVVEKHRGSLTFESEVGVGTTFFIRLPISQEEAKAA